MADIFISWGSPDKDAVVRLVRRLHDLGLKYFEYTDQMESEKIADQVLSEISKAKLALLCMSDKTVNREWFLREVNWCYSEKVKRKMEMILVRVGPLNDSAFPELIKDRYAYNLACSAVYENELNRLVIEIYKKLGYHNPPVVIPATVVAMINQECREISLIQDQLNRLRNLYLQAGIGHEEDWLGSFQARYRETPEAFSPFSIEETIKDLVQNVLDLVNQSRRALPIWINWYSRRLLLEKSKEGDLAREDWRRDAHMIIIDAVSLLNKNIETDLVNILSLNRNEKRRALIWIPPHTRHAQQLQDVITQIDKPVGLGTLLEDWQKRPECCLSFDIGTNVSLRRWLNKALRDLAEPPPPVESNKKVLEREAGSVGFEPEKIHRG